MKLKFTRLDVSALLTIGGLAVALLLVLVVGKNGVRGREPQVVYVAGQNGQRELWVVGLEGGPGVQLTDTGGRLFDFAVAPDGERIALSVYNDRRGVDLWLVDRDGQNGRILLDCQAARCTTPAWSPDGAYLAYSREAAPLEVGKGHGAPRLRMLHLASGQEGPVYADSQVVGHGPAWSPDGRRIASWDGPSGGIRVLDLQTDEQVLLATETGASGAWSPGGKEMLFTRYETVEGAHRAAIYRADFESGETRLFLNSEGGDAAYGMPAWSPDGERIAFSLRFDQAGPARSIQIVGADGRPSGLVGSAVGGEADYIYGFYSWDAPGKALLFQRTRLGSVAETEVGVYWLATGETRFLAKGDGWPQWLP